MKQRIEDAREKALSLLKVTPAQVEHGLELHRESLVVDAFGFAPYAFTRKMVETLNQLNDEGATADELSDRMLEMRVTESAHDPEAREQVAMAWEASGVTGTMQTCGGAGPVESVMRHFARFFYDWDQMPDLVQKATRPDDVKKAKEEGRHCQFISLNGLPGAFHVGDLDAGLRMVDTFYHLGCRMMHLTYNLRTLLGDGCVERADGGLSEFGHEAVERMNEVGILVDVPHSGRQTTLDAAKASRVPMAASHTACQSVYDHARGKSDEEIKAIVETGGFVGICCIPHFLGERGTIVDLLDHVDYLVKLAGVDHAAIGTDVGTVPPAPEGVKLNPFPRSRKKERNWRPEHRPVSPEVSEECRTGSLMWTNWPCFTVGMVQRGYSDQDIQKIIGGNVLRVLDDVAKCAKR